MRAWYGHPLTLQLADQDFMCVGVEEHAALLMDTVLATANLEAVKVHFLPAERDLQIW
jgi:hypothetical protein